MKTKKRFIPSVLPLIMAASFLTLVGCSQDRVEKKTSPFDNPFVTKSTEVFGKAISPLSKDSLLPPTSACERLNTLEQRTASTSRVFSLFERLNWQQMKGRLSIINSPLTQLLLATQVKTPTDQEFYALAREEYEAGNLSTIKWNALRAAYSTGIYYQTLKHNAIKDKTLETFPGVFGESTDITKSYPISLMRRVTDLDELQFDFVSHALSAHYPLFDSDHWENAAEQTALSLRSALAAVYGDQQDHQNILCGFILFQRSFAQLLQIKGYPSPTAIRKALPQKIRKSGPAFRTRKIVGLWLKNDELDNEAQKQVLTKEDISNYAPSVANPSETIYRLSKDLMKEPYNKNEKTTSSANELDRTLDYLEMMAHFLEFTSPVNNWALESGDYFFGDLKDTSKESKVILPSDAHTLSLGLLILAFKNFKEENLMFVDKENKLLSKEDIKKDRKNAAGIAIGLPEEIKKDEVNIKLSQVATLMRTIAYVKDLLDRMSEKSVDWLKKQNPSLDSHTIALLLGDKVFSKEALDSLLSDEEQKEVRIKYLTDLQLPLLFLMKKFEQKKPENKNTKNCVQNIRWNLRSGAIKQGANCTVEDQKVFQRALTLLAHKVQSPLILE